MKIVKLFGGKDKYETVIRDLQTRLYDVPPELLYQRSTGGQRLGV